MKQRTLLLLSVLAAAGAAFLTAQTPDGKGTIVAGDKTRIAVPDFRGKGAAAPLMGVFNDTVWNDLGDSGVLTLIAKTLYPLETPNSPADFRPPSVVNGQTVKNGPWLTDWSGPPVSTNYLGIGNVDVNGADLVLRGSLLNVGLADVATASVFANKVYFGPANEEGARKIAHEYAADVLKQLGAVSLSGTKIYFVSDRTGQKEIWSMDHDGQNQRQMTRHRTLSGQPSVSPDGRLAAYATMINTGENRGWQIRVMDTLAGRQQPFLNPVTSLLATPEFAPDNSKLWFSMVIDGWQQIFVSNVDGSNRQRISQVRAIETEPCVNPRNPNEVLFISGRSGRPQLYKMNANGTGTQMITTGEGDVANPAWSPDGRKVAFSWTRGYDPGSYNVFIMDVSNRSFVQLTRQSGSNEHPFWAPDGVHLVFSRKVGNSTQIFSMLADGTRVKQLTTAGDNAQPVWSKGTN